jgi:hypothetical protein
VTYSDIRPTRFGPEPRMRLSTASGNSVSRRYKEQRSRRPSSSRMRIWSQFWSWFPVSHAAKSQVPKMSAKQQECDRAGNAQGAKDLSAINPAAPATMLALPSPGAAENRAPAGPLFAHSCRRRRRLRRASPALKSAHARPEPWPDSSFARIPFPANPDQDCRRIGATPGPVARG